MTDRPILFSAPMIKALIAGRKTMTRRLLKPLPLPFDDRGNAILREDGTLPDWRPSVRFAVGDRLWVKETHRLVECDCPETCRVPGKVWYEATHDGYDGCRLNKKRSSLFMPRWASRLTLTVTDVRVHRLLDITEEDAIAEGVTDFAEAWDQPGMWNGLKPEHRIGITRTRFGSCRQAFHALWDHLNGSKPGASWESNPWVAACHFRCELKNIDSPSVARAVALEPI